MEIKFAALSARQITTPLCNENFTSSITLVELIMDTILSVITQGNQETETIKVVPRESEFAFFYRVIAFAWEFAGISKY